MTCVDCERRHEHCHGTWIEHADGGECTDDDCRLPAEAHEHRTECDDCAEGGR